MPLRATVCVYAALLCPVVGRSADLSGRLGYLKHGAAWIAPANGDGRRLPNSDGARILSLRPNDGTAFYFVPVATGDHDDGSVKGFVSGSPYTTSAALAAPLTKANIDGLIWSGDGGVGYVTGYRPHGLFDPDSRHVDEMDFSAESISADGGVVAWRTEKEVRVWVLAGDQNKALFSIGRPQALFKALRAAARPKNIESITEMLDEDLWRSSANWQVGPPAVSPDGAKVYFATNAGTGAGAAGNCSWCWFVADVATGRLAVLSKHGEHLCRTPHYARVAPDGRRLLFLTSLHDSAVSNPCSAWVMELLTQDARELLWADVKVPENQDIASLTDGACWSPDSRYVAVSSYFYNPAEAFKDENFEPRDEDYELKVYDAATGKVARTITGAHQPAWSN